MVLPVCHGAALRDASRAGEDIIIYAVVFYRVGVGRGGGGKGANFGEYGRLIAMRPPKKITLTIGDPNTTPETVESQSALELAAAYLEMLQRIAEDEDRNLTFTGIEVRSGSCKLAFKPSDTKQAKMSVQRGVRLLTGGRATPPRLRGAVGRVESALARAPGPPKAKVAVGKWTRQIMVRKPQRRSRPEAQTTLRVQVERVGGAQPKLRVRSTSEDAFTLSVSKELARKVGPHLYKEVEVTALISRDEDGTIEGGELLSFAPVNEGDALSAWQDWFQENASEWNTVEDIDKELGRGD